MFVTSWQFAQFYLFLIFFFSPFSTTCELNTPFPLHAPTTLHTLSSEAASLLLLGTSAVVAFGDTSSGGVWGHQQRWLLGTPAAVAGGMRAQKKCWFLHRVLQKGAGIPPWEAGAERAASPKPRGARSEGRWQMRSARPAVAATRPRCHRAEDPPPSWRRQREKEKHGSLQNQPEIWWQERQRRTQARQVLFLPALDAEQTSCEKRLAKTPRDLPKSVWVSLTCTE